MGTQWKLAGAVVLVAGGLWVAVAGASSPKGQEEEPGEFGSSTGDFCTTLCAGPDVPAVAYRNCVQTCANAKDESAAEYDEAEFGEE